MSDYPNESDFHEALTTARVCHTTLSSDQLWALAAEVKRLRTLGPALEQVGRVFFNADTPPRFTKNGRAVVHTGSRAMNGLFAACGAVAYDRTTTFVSTDNLATCEKCLKAIEISEAFGSRP